MGIDQIIVDYAITEVEDFINWVKKRDPELVKQVLGEDSFYKISNVEKLFDALEQSKKTDYQFLVDNEHNFAVARQLGLLEPSLSMPSGEPGHLLKKSIHILGVASIDQISNPEGFTYITEITELGKPTSIFENKGGTDMSPLDSVMKTQAMNNIDKVRQVFIITDGEPIKEQKPKK